MSKSGLFRQFSEFSTFWRQFVISKWPFLINIIAALVIIQIHTRPIWIRPVIWISTCTIFIYRVLFSRFVLSKMDILLKISPNHQIFRPEPYYIQYLEHSLNTGHFYVKNGPLFWHITSDKLAEMFVLGRSLDLLGFRYPIFSTSWSGVNK